MTYQKNNLQVIEEDISLDHIARKQASQVKALILNKTACYNFIFGKYIKKAWFENRRLLNEHNFLTMLQQLADSLKLE